MSTIGWLFIFSGLYLIRSVVKGQVFDAEGNFVLLSNSEQLLTALITGDKTALQTLDQQGPAGLNVPTPSSGPSSFTDGGESGGGGGGGGGASWEITKNSLVASGTPDGWDKLNPRTPAQAVSYALSHSSFPSGMCERMVTVAYGHAGGFPTAKAHADAMRLMQGTPPAGALVFIASKNPAQHVGLSVGGGQMVSTDFDGSKYVAGRMSRGSVGQVAAAMGGPVRGWSAPVFR